jgi:hypothetical protein
MKPLFASHWGIPADSLLANYDKMQFYQNLAI